MEVKSKVTKVFSNDRMTFFQIDNNPKMNFGFSNKTVATVGGISYVVVHLESQKLVTIQRSFKSIDEDFMFKVYPDIKEYTKYYVTK